jgi:hypothetical protein
VRAQDAESGLRRIEVLKSVNARVTIPTFTAGTNDVVTVVATKTDATEASVNRRPVARALMNDSRFPVADSNHTKP